MKRPRCNKTAFKPHTSYEVWPGVRVAIGLAADGTPLYCVDEGAGSPECDLAAWRIASAAASKAILEGIEERGELREVVREAIEQHESEGLGVPDKCSAPLPEHALYLAEKVVKGYGPLYPAVLDDQVEELAVDPPLFELRVVHRGFGGVWLRTNIVVDAAYADKFIQLLARRAGRELSIAHPYAEGLLPEGHRVAATLGREVSRLGSSIIVRKHRSRPLSMAELVGRSLGVAVAAYLWELVEMRASMLIVGPTASGKTTLLQALLDLVPPWSRVVSVEDTPELNLSHLWNWDSLVARPVYSEDEGEDVDLHKLARFALRRRPDYLVIGEVRGEEARVLVYAAGSGHAALSTFHAETALGALRRLRYPPFSLSDAMVSSINVVVALSRPMAGRARRVREIVEIEPRGDGYEIRRVYDGAEEVEFGDIVERSFLLRGAGGEAVERLEEKASILSEARGREELLALVREYYAERLRRMMGVGDAEAKAEAPA